MPVATQRDIASQMIRQLRILDPSASAELGTPERKIIDTVAQALADAQVDLSLLSEAFTLDTKFGQDLDNFLAIFGFARQKGTVASGVVEFSRDVVSNHNIRIPAQTQIAASVVFQEDPAGFNQAIFETTTDVYLYAGELVVTAPIRAVTPGAFGNVAADSINSFVGTPTLGITAVTNPVATSGGQNAEQDDPFKVRFRNTIFRNLAGTGDQFLALAVTGVFTNKANVIGPISRYREYIQVPDFDDATPYDINGDLVDESGNGSVGEYTTAISTIPYSEYTYEDIPAFVSNGESGAGAIFYTQGVDFDMNITADRKNRGDAYRLASIGEGPDPITDLDTTFQPNVTLFNIFTGVEDVVEAARPGDTLTFEHSYVSSASRNDWSRNITNCVDVYANGENSTLATTVSPTPRLSVNAFVDNPTGRLHFDDYRRLGEPDHRPVIGNVFTALFWSPVIGLPETITVGTTVYYLNTHYWGVYDVSDNQGTVRARTGIEWSVIENGQGPGDPEVGPYTGELIVDHASNSVEIENYAFDKNIVDLQTAYEGAKQVTTDVLIHQATMRYFRLDVTIMYSAGANQDEVNQSIQQELDRWMRGMYFGSVIQLSDALQHIHNTQGVDNVRWSREFDASLDCITETNTYSEPRLGATIDRVVPGTGAIREIQQVYLTGDPSGGTWTLTHSGLTTGDIAFDDDMGALQLLLDAAAINATVLSGEGTALSPFRIRWDSYGAQALATATTTPLTSTTTTFNNDFFLRDNELPTLPTVANTGDSIAGLIARPRAQNTWRRG